MTKRTTFGIALFVAMIMALTVAGIATARADTNFGTSTPRGLTGADNKYGHVDVVRKFHGGLPDWNLRRSQVVSFKALPSAINSGRHDRYLRNWFRNAPNGTPIWWSYWHEPTNNFRTQGAKRAYRVAWRHIVRIERSTPTNGNLKATYINTLASAWKGNWSHFYAGNKWIDVLGFDTKIHNWEGRYIPARKYFADAPRLANRLNKPWGLAETGSTVFNGNYQGRARWMRDMAHWAQNRGARFVEWWDQSFGAKGDFRLNDRPSIKAMRWMLRGRWQ